VEVLTHTRAAAVVLGLWLLPQSPTVDTSTRATSASTSDLVVQDLRCEYVSRALGVDVRQPRLFWKLSSSRRGERQTAYRVLAASTPAILATDVGDLWDSGKVGSDDSTHVPYAGKPLRSSQEVFWKVRAWDRDDQASAWSEPSEWTMGLLEDRDWGAQWIGDRADSETVLLRRVFHVKPGLARALVHVAGLGQYELSINGQKAGDDVLSPGWTKYDVTCLYDTRDLTSVVREGPNAIGVLLGNGMYRVHGGRYTKFKGSYGQLTARVHLRLEYRDGTTEIIGSDGEWRASAGPIMFSCVYGGEDYDARAEPQGWDTGSFDDSKWRAAVVLSGPGGTLKGLTSAAPAIRMYDVLEPRHVTTLNDHVTVYDLGQNAALIPRITVRGPAGSIVRITPAELLKEDGTVDRESVGGGEAYWQYTLAGTRGEAWLPKFFYHGSRYLQVERSPAVPGGELPRVESLAGVVVHSSSPSIGEFESSSELFNRVHRLVRWAQRSNLMSVITDCPHRERLGWLEQYHLNGPSLRYGFDLSQLFTKGMSDMADSQLPGGLVPDIAPEYTVFEKGFRDSPEWGSAFVIVPWQQYEWTGDLELLRRHYDRMARYVAYLGSTAREHIVSHGLGDWYDIGPGRPGLAQLTPVSLTATAFYYEDARIMARAAALLGKHEDGTRYNQLATDVRAAFNSRFFDPSAGQYGTGSQVANAIPLVMDLVEPRNRATVLDAIVRDVRRRGNALTAGDVGYRYLLRALADGGRSDVIFDMNHQSEKPGYGYQLRMGATSLTEAWNADRRSSQNHFMLGQIMEWFYHDLAGIQVDPSAPGFRRIVIAPQPVGTIRSATARLDSIRGPIVSSWSRSDSVLTLDISVPANTTATVWVPVPSSDGITIDGEPPLAHDGVRLVGREPRGVAYAVPSGHWVFEARTQKGTLP
jgi:alpha-L-rhamnosidase